MIDKDETSFVVDALHSIRPNSEFIVGESYASLDWHSKDQVKPTEEEFNDALSACKTEYSNNEYARKRAQEYPSNGDQWDMIYKDNKNGTTTHADAVEAVKAKWPKDNSGPV